jgi:hypothetical protein
MEGDAQGAIAILQNRAEMAHFFGLGFIQVKVSPSQRYHFYHQDLPSFVDNPHDHRYDFVSKVLKGCLKTTVWQEGIDGIEGSLSYQCAVEFSACTPEGQAEVPEGRDSYVVKRAVFETHAPSTYFFPHDWHHQVDPDFNVGSCITKVTKLTEHLKDFAKVFILNREACPYSKKLNEAELWNYVERCIVE